MIWMGCSFSAGLERQRAQESSPETSCVEAARADDFWAAAALLAGMWSQCCAGTRIRSASEALV